MSRNEARGHNYKNPLAAPTHQERPDRIVCKGCRSTMQAVTNPDTGEPYDRCFSCSMPLETKRRRKQ